MKRLALFATLFLLAWTGSAQTEWCGTAPRATAVQPTANERAELDRIRTLIEAQPSNRSSDEVFVIPVVVHIIHWNGIGDITDEQVEDGIRIMNEDFRRQNPDTVNTNSIFQPFAADIGIEFRLAQLDPDGNPTTGITRTDTSMIPHLEPTEPEFDNVKYLVNWPSHKYFNVWLVRSILGGAAGYAQYPGTEFTYGGPWETYGAVIRHNYWGSIGTAIEDGRTATHEMGHCLGLYHTFLSQTAGCGAECDTTGDEVCDTPPCLPNTSCPATLNSCANDSLGPSAYANNVLDQKENYMGYSTCQNMFSQGQKERMLGFFNAFDTLRDLSSAENLVATGILTPPAGVNEPVVVAPLRLAPNVTGHSTTLSSESQSALGRIDVLDLNGRIVLTTQTNQPRVNLDVAGLSDGVYYVRATGPTGPRVAQLIVLKR